MRHSLLVTVLSLGLLLLTPVALFGQTERGAIVGIVTDSTGAVVPNATVTVTNIGTNTSQTFTTNTDGLYEAPFLTPGAYKVTATAPGFSTTVNDRVTVNVSARVRVNMALQTGNVTAQVQVESTGESLVQTENANIGQVITNRQLTELPSRTRNIYDFLLLNSNVTAPPSANAGNRLENGPVVAISGTRLSSVTYKIDGLSNTDQGFGTPTITPSLDSVKEFRLQNNAYSAEFEGIGQVNVATQNGTDRFHGTLFDFVQNDVFQPRNPLNKPDKTGKPGKNRLRFNQFGGTIGGPVWLPHFGEGGRAVIKDNTFFFFSYEGRRQNNLAAGQTQVLTSAERAGDFSDQLGGCVTSGGQPVPLFNPNGTPSGQCVRVGQIFDPATTVANPLFNPNQPASAFNPQYIRQPFPNNQIPSNRRNPTAQAIINLQQPPPNFSGAFNFLGQSGLIFQNDQYSVRIDHKVSDSDSIYGRFTWQNNFRITKALLPFSPTSPNLQGKGRVFNFTWTRILSSSLVNEFRVGYVRGVYGQTIDTIDPNQFGIHNTVLQTLPRINISGNNNITYGGFGFSLTQETQNTYQLADNVSLIRGRHSLKFGFQGEHNRFKNNDLGGSNGAATFTGLYTTESSGVSAGNRTNAVADFLLGMANSTSLSINNAANVRNTPWSAYVQDDWKVKPRITVNIGLRYELHQPWREKLLGGAIFDVQNGGHLIVADPKIAQANNSPLVVCCTGPRVVKTDKMNFAPRIGIAIQPFKHDNTVIRAGYGIYYSDMTQFYDWLLYTPAGGAAFNPPNGDFLTPGGTLPDLFPSNRFIPADASYLIPTTPVVAAASGTRFRIAASALPSEVGSNRTPYAQQYSLSIQREMLRNLLVEIDYTGSVSKHLPGYWFFNQAPASPVQANYNSPDPAANPDLRVPYKNIYRNSYVLAHIFYANYNAMTVKVEKRFSKGYSFLSSYTWSKTLDNGSEVFQISSTLGTPANSRNLNQDYGAASYDIPHRWVTSGIVELPFGRGKSFLNSSGWVDKLVGGWRISGDFTLQSGFPFQIVAFDRLTNTGYSRETERGNLVSNPYWPADVWKTLVAQWKANGNSRLYLIDPNSISTDYPPGTYGNIPRNFFRGPFGRNLDFSVAKVTRLGETTRLELRADVLGATNERLHRTDIPISVYASAVNALTSPLRGSIPSYNAFFNPRTIQLGVKFTF